LRFLNTSPWLVDDLIPKAPELELRLREAGLAIGPPTTPTRLRVGARVSPIEQATVAREWRTPDWRPWIQLVEHTDEEAARRQLSSDNVGQVYTGLEPQEAGYWPFFTVQRDDGMDAVSAVVRRGRHLISVGYAIPFKITSQTDGENTPEELAYIDASIDSTFALLEAAGHAFLLPGATAWVPRASPDHRLSRIAGFAWLWSEVKYNFVFLEQRPELDWEHMLEAYLPGRLRLPVTYDESLFDPNVCIITEDANYWSVKSVEDNLIMLHGCGGDMYPYYRPLSATHCVEWIR